MVSKARRSWFIERDFGQNKFCDLPFGSSLFAYPPDLFGISQQSYFLSVILTRTSFKTIQV
jgi:hypothetical protein